MLRGLRGARFSPAAGPLLGFGDVTASHKSAAWLLRDQVTGCCRTTALSNALAPSQRARPACGGVLGNPGRGFCKPQEQCGGEEGGKRARQGRGETGHDCPFPALSSCLISLPVLATLRQVTAHWISCRALGASKPGDGSYRPWGGGCGQRRGACPVGRGTATRCPLLVPWGSPARGPGAVCPVPTKRSAPSRCSVNIS